MDSAPSRGGLLYDNGRRKNGAGLASRDPRNPVQTGVRRSLHGNQVPVDEALLPLEAVLAADDEDERLLAAVIP